MRRRSLPVLLTSLVLCLAACGGPDGGGPDGGSSAPPEATPPEATPKAQTAPLPELDLSAADPAVREQIDRSRRAVEDAGDNPAAQARAYSDLGLVYLTYEFLGAAGTCFENARSLEPTNFRWHYLLGYLEMIQGRLPEAADLYGRALELEAGFLPAVLRLGRTRLQLSDLDAAEARFRAALELDPVAAGHAGLGRVAAARGDDSAAVEHFRTALDLEPEADALHYALAQSYRNLGQMDRARHHLERSGDVATRIADPLINPLASLAEGLQFYLVQGAEAMDDGRYDGAAASYRAALEQDPASFEAHRGLAVSLERLGDLEGAAEALDRAASSLGEGAEGAAGADDATIRGQRAALLRSRGLVAALRGRDGRALESYLASLELVPEQPDVLLRAAGGLAKLGRFEDAIGLYDRLESLEPAWAPAVWERRGTAWVNLGRADEAIADFDRAVDAAPEDALLRSRYAAALEHLGRRADAQRRAAADLSAGSDPQTRAALAVERARGQLRSGALEEAMASYREALGAQPDHLPARRGLAQLLAHHGRFEEAVEHLEQVLEASPRHEGARRDHAVALVLAERYGEARLALQEALRLFPRHLGFALTQVELLSTTPDESVRDGGLAVRIAERITAENDGAVARQSLAFAYAAAGRFDDAKRVQRRLLEEAEAGGNEALIAELRSRLERFEAGRPQIAAAPTDIVFPLVAGR